MQTRPAGSSWPKLFGAAAAGAIVASGAVFALDGRAAAQAVVPAPAGPAPREGSALPKPPPQSRTARLADTAPQQRQAPKSVLPTWGSSSGAAPPPEAEMPPAEYRDRIVSELRASGPDQRGLVTPAAKVMEGWSAKVARFQIEGRFSGLECHAKGCLFTIVHGSEGDADLAMQVITRTGEFNAWQSGKMRSGAVPRQDGKVEVTWVLFPPEAGTDALTSTLPPDNLEELMELQPPG